MALRTIRTPDPRIREILERLENAAHSEVSVNELARSVRLSPSRFSHLFALEVGMTPGKYLKLVQRSATGIRA